MKKIILILASGHGKRMNSNIPKQFMSLAGIPILYHTIRKFWNFDNSIEIVVTLPSEYLKYWKKICRDYKFTIKHKIRTGGETRFESVKKGLRGIKPGCIVGIHDAVRPLVSKHTIKRCYDTAEKNGTGIPVIDINESLRIINNGESNVADRSKYKLVQTPQVFKSELLLEAYKQEFSPEFTDDATVIEKFGQKIHLVKGNNENLKITSQADLIVAEAIFRDTQYHL